MLDQSPVQEHKEVGDDAGGARREPLVGSSRRPEVGLLREDIGPIYLFVVEAR